MEAPLSSKKEAAIPQSLRLEGVTIDSIYYYGKLVYKDVNLRSYFGSIRPPARLTFGFRLGRCILIHFPKRTFIHFFLPRRPRRLKRREKSRPGKVKDRWWAFGKVGPIGCLHSSYNTEEERNEVRGRRAGKRVEPIRLDALAIGGKQNEIRIWPKKKQRYGYHDRSPSIKKNLSKSLRVSGAFKHPKYAGVVNDIAFLIENDDSFRKTAYLFFSGLGDRSAIGVLRDLTQGNQCRAYDDAARFHFVEVPGRGKGCR
ncbi:ribosomal protein S3, mitochondrial-like [Arachis duranensis]|uniref:Ribosomal protein S3, mitochondrial-like n=1 Tax=Arachis duranensis TaxID=130453 RepID=A0A9C6T9T2_ARADU|nr:ribosomal protein S3, mitochondrial-like [Arachis duranensis]